MQECCSVHGTIILITYFALQHVLVLLQYECENVLNDAALMEACGVGLSRNDMYGVMMVCKQLGEDPKLAVATVRFFGKVVKFSYLCCKDQLPVSQWHIRKGQLFVSRWHICNVKSKYTQTDML